MFIWALNLYPLNNSLKVTAYTKFILNSGEGETTGGTVDKAIFSFFIPTFKENNEFIACCTSNSGITFLAFLAEALALCAPSI